MANTRLALGVEVEPGNKNAAMYGTDSLFKWLNNTPVESWPAFVRCDSAFGNEPMLIKFEEIKLVYLSKLRLTSKVKLLIDRLFKKTEWVDAGQGWESNEDTLKLSGWSKSRRVIVLRRLLRGEIALESDSTDNTQLHLFIGTGEAIKKYEYAVLVTNLSEEILTIAQHYRDRADCENIFDELKNQWGWGGYTTKDIKTALTRLSSFLNIIKTVAEQLSVEERCMLILKQAFSEMLQNWSNKWLKLLPSLS